MIPNITHATYRILKGDVRKDFTVPTNVVYICDKGYGLEDPYRYVVECEFPGATQGERGDNASKPQWKNFSGIICHNGKLIC